MTIKRIAGARRFAIRVDMQHDPSHLFPIRVIGFGVKKSPIRHQMLLVIGRQHRLIWHDIRDIGI